MNSLYWMQAEPPNIQLSRKGSAMPRQHLKTQAGKVVIEREGFLDPQLMHHDKADRVNFRPDPPTLLTAARAHPVMLRNWCPAPARRPGLPVGFRAGGPAPPAWPPAR